jgi:hypothetical protein
MRDVKNCGLEVNSGARISGEAISVINMSTNSSY